MPNIIDSSFFVGELNVPNSEQSAVLERLNLFISKYEFQCLNGILGYELYKALTDSPTDQRMVDLLDGKEFTSSYGVKSKWIGLKHDTNQSLIANFVYYYWKRDEVRQSTGYGTMIQEPEKGQMASPAFDMVQLWNEFSEQCCQLREFLCVNSTVYPEFTWENKYASELFSYPQNSFDL